MRVMIENLAQAPRPALAPEPRAAPAALPPQASPEEGPMAALINFTQNRQPEGPISHTAQRFMGGQPAEQTGQGSWSQPSGHVQMPQLPATVAPHTPGHSWAPYGARRLQTQAERVLWLLSDKERTQTVNPYWSNLFWNEVASLEAQDPFEPDLRRLLAAAGYVGPGTAGPPKGPLSAQLSALIASGAPPHGAGVAPRQEPGGGWLSSALGVVDDQWENRLPPDMARAAPEIYRSCRSAGASSIRMWLDRHYAGARNDTNPAWTDLWNAATRIDFAIARCSSSGEVAQLLASDDDLEIDLRRLAAEEYRARTGDACGANQMLAVKPPGVGVDLATGCLVNEITAHPEADHQRRERVRSSSSYFRGRGADRGRGRGGAPAGQYASGQAEAPAGDRGRGRGGRRGRGR